MTVKTTKPKKDAPVVAKPEPTFHYFGSTCYNWAVGSSRQEVLDKLAGMVGAERLKRTVKANGGLYAWTCVVDAPLSATYEIAFFQPQGVLVGRGLSYNIVNTKGAVRVIDSPEDSAPNALSKAAATFEVSQDAGTRKTV